MTFNDDANVSGSSARRRGRGRNTAIAAGGIGGFGVIAVLVLSLVTGTDLTGLLQGGTGDDTSGGTSDGQAVEGCATGADANTDDACRIAATQIVLDEFWEANVEGYVAPSLVVVDGSTQSACGTASNATGPFYCPPEQTVYIDPTFFGVLRQQFGATAGSLAQMYVLAHEWGHHIQQLIGVMDEHPRTDSGPASDGVRIELQADCFAGAWVADAANYTDDAGVSYLQPPTNEQITDALNAAAAVGDDHIQEESTGRVNPESWTHGSSEQRQRWFTTGYEGGIGSCDTFAASAGSL